MARKERDALIRDCQYSIDLSLHGYGKYASLFRFMVLDFKLDTLFNRGPGIWHLEWTRMREHHPVVFLMC